MTIPSAPGAAYTLTLLGNIDLHGPTPDVGDVLVNAKVVATLAYLAIPSVGRFVRRDSLVGLLWPELDQARARKALRQVVWTVRGALGDDVLLGRGDEELALSAD